MTNDRRVNPDSNPDPITGAPGAHPVGVGLGAVAGGIAAGAAAGTMAAGPLGTAVGAVVGAVVGGLGGKAVAEGVNPTAEENYWRDNYQQEPYFRSGTTFDDYAPAYRLGVDAPNRYGDRSFDDVESVLEHDYSTLRGQSRLEWGDAKHATRAAWDRIRG